MSHEAHAQDDGEVHVHTSSVGFYGGILGVLLVFTVLTFALSFVHLGPLNLALAVLIATLKAGLVVTFFMHLKDDSRFNALIFVGSLLFAGIFLAYTMNDTATRGELDPASGVRVHPRTGKLAPGMPADVARPVYPTGARSH